MNISRILCVVAAAGALSASAAFDETERSAVRKAVSEVESAFRVAAALDGKAITLLPVKGDSEGFCERLVIGSLVKAGKTCVVSNDEKNDERFRRILSEIKWDEAQTTLKSIDPKTADELGHLKSTQILLEARVDVFRRGRKRRAVAELGLIAYEVKTKQYVWSADIAVDSSGRAWPNPSEYNVKVSFSAPGDDAASLAGLVAAKARNQVAGYGYRVDGDGAVDLELSAAFAQKVFDRSGEYVVLSGIVHAKLMSKTGDGVLYEKTFECRGGRGLGEDAAIKNLADGISAQVAKWIADTLEPRVFFSKHRDFEAAAEN